MTGHVSKIEKRMSSIEATGKETNLRVGELEKKNTENNEKLVNLSHLRSKFDTFVRDNKTDSEQVNEELCKVKKELSSLDEKQKEFLKDKNKKDVNMKICQLQTTNIHLQFG